MAKEIVIYDVDGSVILTAPLTKSAEWECKVMTSDQVTLSWVDAEQVTIPMGAFVINPINNLKYYSVEPYVPAMKDTAKYEYKPVFYHEIFTLNKIPFLLYTYDAEGNVESVESDWNFTGSGADLALQLEHAIEQGIGTAYTVEIDPVITASLSLSFGNVDILSAINDMADAWECEWWTEEQINGEESDKIIHFGKLCQHYGTGTEPLKLTAGVEVECPQSNNKATFYNRFYVFGGTNNIPQDYNGAQVNHVVNKRLTLNPEKFPNGYIDLPKFDDDGNALKDEDGNYIPDDSLTSSTRRYTKVLQFNDIYPKCNCRIKYSTLKSCQRYVRDDNDDLIKLADGTYDQWYLYCFKLEYQEDGGAWKDFTINKSTYSEKTNPNGSIIKGKTLSLHFNSGALEGREFEATYHDAAKTFRSEDGSTTFAVDAGYFEVVHSEDNTIILPNTGIAPSEGTNGNHDGDKVVVFNIRMPESYYQTAYTELEAEAIEEIWDETKDSNEYTVKTNQVYFSKSNPHLTLGRRVELWQGSKSSETRVIGLKMCLDRQYDASITFGKKIRTGTISTLLTEVTENAAKTQAVSVANEVAIKMNKQQLYAAQREMYDSMFDTDGNFTAPISPLAVQTTMLSVGATSQNFQLADITFVPNDPTTGSETPYNCFRVDCGKSAKLVHYGLDYEATEPTEWTFSNQNLSDELSDMDAVYYLYALCPKDGTEGIFELTTEQRKYDSMLDTTGEYCFLVGVLSSASTDDNGTCRVLNLSYGSTTVNGRFVRTGRIESVDGGTYFDLDTGEIGGNIKFKATSDNTSVINSIINGNSTVQSAVTTANSAASSASSAASSAASAASSASSAASTATAAKSAIDNFNAGGRNYIKNSAANMTLTYYNANTFNRATLVDGANGMTFDDENTYAWISYYIDGWTETFPPSNQGFNLGGFSDGTDTWKWGSSYMVDSGYKQINSTTRRYWYKATSKGMKLTRCGLYTNNTSYKPTTNPVVYNVMLSFGTALADYTEAPEDVDYLRQALTEATAGTTSIDGGLVLSNMISVGSGSNGLLAGMCGTSQAGDGSFPMIWAGATAQSKEGVMGAKFRVYNDGQTIMSAAKILGKGIGNTGMVMDNGAITFGKLTGDNIAAADKLTEITTTTYDTIQATLNGMESADVKDDPTVSKTITPTWNSANNQGGEMCSADSTTTLLSFTVGSNVAAGNLFFTPSGKVTSFAVKSSLVSSYKATYYNNTVSATLSLVIRRNGADVATIYTKALRDNENSSTTTAIAIATASASTTNETVDTTTRSIAFAPGDTFTLVAKMTYNSFIYTVPNHSLKHTTGTDAYSATLNIGLSYTSKAPVYNNVYFANGMFLSSANTQYFAVVPKDPIIFQARSSNALLKFGANGLMQSLNGGTYAAAAPRLYSVEWNSSTNTYTPYGRNCAVGTISRSDTGKFTLTHNLGSTKYLCFVQVKAISTEAWWDFAKVAAKADNTVTIWIIDRNGSFRDDDCDVAIFPYA